MDTRQARVSRGHTDTGRAARLSLMILLAVLGGCGIPDSPNPPGSESGNTTFLAISQSTPKYLDPTSSYAVNETPFTYEIYEPFFRYHYLKRPYVLEGRAAEEVPLPHYLDKDGKTLSESADPSLIAQSVYDIKIRRGILYAPHPAFAKDASGEFLYHHLKPGELNDKFKLPDFKQTGTRELVADDYVYGIKRLATPRVKSPVFSVMENYILGMKDLSLALRAADNKMHAATAPTDRDLPFLDLRKFPLAGAEAIDDHTVRIRIAGKYPQFKYWLAMTFFAPVPWEAEEFYAQRGMAERNFSLNNWPAGTGPYMLTDYVENRRMVLERNPNFRGEPYPCEGNPGDAEAGLLADCGKRMPFIDKAIFNVDKEGIALSSKFLQGFYDDPDISANSPYGIVYSLQAADSPAKAAEFKDKGLVFSKSVESNYYYIGFNMWDPVVGNGKTPEQDLRNKKLRQALQIAVNWEEYEQIFEKKAGPPSMGPIPPGVFGYRTGQQGYNPIAYDWVGDHAVRKPLDEAKKLMVEAGYPEGRDAKTGQPLVLNYDFFAAAGPDSNAEIGWLAKQLGQLGIQMEVRATDYNRFQDKMDSGSGQMFMWGWNADYPDAENFMFLLYGPNSKAATKGNGENASNYKNPEFDKLYERMKFLENGPEKQAILDRMATIAREDSPWLWGYTPYSALATQNWLTNIRPTQMVRDVLEYRRLDPAKRVSELKRWNHPIFWPVWLIILLVLSGLIPAWQGFKRREQASALPSGGVPPQSGAPVSPAPVGIQ